MNVNGLLFISCFLPTVFLLHTLLSGYKLKNSLLLIAGLAFCAFGSLSGVMLLVVIAVLNYIFGRQIIAGNHRKLFCVSAVAIDLAFLGFFKYLNFLLAQLLRLPAVELGIAVPLGISFYTFKCISYIIDIYRDREQGTGNFSEFLLYVSFFPQITAGPISRFPQFRSQINERKYHLQQCALGFRRFVIGLGKQVIISGTLAKLVDEIFALPSGALNIPVAWIGAIAYMLQIYIDFSGYSDMAIGLGQIFGFVSPENFNYPYMATSITDFWRRWHLSLSTWFKDYLYIPLGGNRKGKLRTVLNKCIVFLFCGIWHGAAWNFVIWGLWHGLFSALESGRVIRTKQGVLSRLYTLLVVCLGFVMFRSASVEQGFQMILAMFGGAPLAVNGFKSLLSVEALVMLALAALLSIPLIPRLKKFPKWLMWCGCVLLFVLCLLRLASSGFTPFIYAQF